ncbi:hypothetical protein GCM10009630_05800 [Kribbella jejuensis]|uniref:Uncharacterized protein n=1 Tax=Kribbella jejuensis TaxID=236068 RepID=A0A542ER88_9ACTN|nr:hypothetical protein [Kribbella jejuensis]TQJ17850.1 hypothetical protein FB475_1979 [Kribbella jejuensis]
MDRAKLRDRLVTAAVVATVLAVIGVTNALATGGGSGTGPLPGPDPAPAAMRLVGYGHAAIAVPKVWGTNISRCGVPRRDAVLIDDCGRPRPKGLSKVELTTTPPVDFRVDDTFSLNGVRAERTWTSCSDDNVCWGAVGLPSLNVWFRASSSGSAGAVDQILTRITVLPDHVDVPNPRPDIMLTPGNALTLTVNR